MDKQQIDQLATEFKVYFDQKAQKGSTFLIQPSNQKSVFEKKIEVIKGWNKEEFYPSSLCFSKINWQLLAEGVPVFCAEKLRNSL